MDKLRLILSADLIKLQQVALNWLLVGPKFFTTLSTLLKSLILFIIYLINVYIFFS